MGSAATNDDVTVRAKSTRPGRVMLEIVERPLPYVSRLALRPLASITRVVIHATELPDLALAREYGESLRYPEAGTGASGHWYIDRDGRCECWVPPERIAHHVRGHNADSVGIELVNLGRFPNWYASDAQHWPEAYPCAQINVLIELLAQLQRALPQLCSITGHDALDLDEVPASDDPQRKVRRKLDPGPQFPWTSIAAALPVLERLPIVFNSPFES